MAARRVRIYQEDWLPFQNLPAAAKAFEAATGIGVDLAWDRVGVGTIEHMFDQMARSFGDDDPPFDLVCIDEVMLRAYARDGRVLELDEWMARDGVTLADYTPETVEEATYEGRCIGLPCVNVSSMLMFRRDLLERYGLPVPSSWDELRQVGTTLQEAVRRDEGRDFWGFLTRGAGGGGHSVWTIGCFLGSFGAKWLDETGRPNPVSDATVAAMACYADLLDAVAPPDQPDCSFVEMRGAFASGRVGIIMDVGMEYAHVLATNPELAERSGIALIPAGPVRRAPNLYSPLWAIPNASPVKAEAWELAKWLCSPRQLLEDGVKSNAIETAPLSVLYSAEFDRHFRDDMLSTVRAGRAIAREERPFGDLGIEACTIVGDITHELLLKRWTPRTAAEAIVQRLGKLADSRGD
ncbi:MAG: extracellular solute-binding protein [Geminicoccaceae bacterium]